MERKIIRRIITFGDYFDKFTKSLDEKSLFKLKQGLLLLATQEQLSPNYVKLIRDGIFELRTKTENKIYRTFFIFDKGNIVVLFNSFQKKTQKTPEKEIKKALRLKKEYYESK